MRRAEAGVTLGPQQDEVASQGIKGMISVGRPFLDYVLSGLADAGVTRVCLVIGPEHGAVREYYRGIDLPVRVAVEFAVQEHPRGTADAVLAAEAFTAGKSLLALNADNYYPGVALAALRQLPRAGLVGFRRSGLVRGENFPVERINAFALIEVSPDGRLTRIVEKPTSAEAEAFGLDPLVSMNAWLLPPTIFDACRMVVPSSRGELELQDAVGIAMERFGEHFLVVESSEPVLDLSTRGDIPLVTARLAGVEVRL
jgi:glucose-1-phosphate thymidylyltransferase